MNDQPGSVTVLEYGAGNLRSVIKAFESAGATVTTTADPAVAAQAERLVLPGQGRFGQCMTQLERTGLAGVICDSVAAGTPFLGICVGMQLLYAGSAEDPGVPGLSLLDGTVERIVTDQPLPHVGWNSVEFSAAAADDPLLAGIADNGPRHFYHVHSFAAPPSPAALGICTYEQTFASVVRGEGRCWGIQFHPEKSQEDGLRILGNFARL